MNRIVLIIFLSFLSNSVFAGKQPKDTILFTYGDKKVTFREFYKGFNKNKHKDSLTKREEVMEYLELYKKFKLKVQDAYDMGLDTTDDFKSELSVYRRQIAKQFLMDTGVNEQLVKEAYERMKYDIKASHILIFSRPDASPTDTLKAYNRLVDIRKMILSDSFTFENAALEFSEDPSAQDNQGNLGYFNAFQMIYEFESQAYNTPVGKISKVFRTEFGYHIVKVTDKRPNKGEVTVRQIRIDLNPAPSKEEIEEKRAKIEEVYKKLQGGEKFIYLVHQYSEDASSVLKNGEIPTFTMTSVRHPENFKNTAFALKKDGDFSEPIQTATGFYIIQRIQLKPLDSMHKIKNYILNKISRDSRQYRNTLVVYERAKNFYKFSENKKYNAAIATYVDSSLLTGEFNAESALKSNPKIGKTVLFQLKRQKLKYTVDSFAKWLEMVQKPSSSDALKSIVNNYYEAYRVQMVMGYYEQDLDNTNEKFASLYKEYKEGILLFSLMDKKVWTKSVEDTTGLKNYYEVNKDKYVFNDRYDITYFRCSSKDIAEKLKLDLMKGTSLDSALRNYNQLNPLNISSPFTGKFEKGANAYIDLVFNDNNQSGKYIIVEDPKSKGGYVLIQVHQFLPASKKTLAEARGSIMSDYQNYLEKQWLEELKTKYPIVVNESVLDMAIKKMVK